jgi:superfamily II DNA or RNA helicase
MITAPTGAGKSVLIRMICRLFYKARIHVATKSAVLASEIRDDLSSVIPDVGMVGGGSRRFGRVTVFVADSLHHGLGQSDILLLDEVHEMITPKYMSAVGRYRTAKVFGFTASPTGRHDGRDVEMEAMCGPVLYNMTYQEAVSGGRVVPITVHWLKTDGPVTTGMDPVERDRIAIWGNESRNRKIADSAAGSPADVQTMIMVRTIDHAVSLKKMLPDYQIVYAPGGMDQDRMTRYVEDGMLPPNEPIMTRQRMNDMKRDFAQGKLTKVIANYVWSTGVNFRHLSVLIRADGAKSDIRSVQIPGRISRRIPGVKESAVLVDCWDAFDPTLLDRSRARRASYRGRGWAETAESVTKPKRTVR